MRGTAAGLQPRGGSLVRDREGKVMATFVNGFNKAAKNLPNAKGPQNGQGWPLCLFGWKQ